MEVTIIPDADESFVHPAEKLKAIRRAAAAAHRAGNFAVVYIAGTECITAHGDKAAHTLAKDHPDWIQRKITGEPAIFGGGSAFWIAKDDEDVWISPYAAEWRKIYMERVRQIAGTGIDGIYIDIPYWMTHFEGWESSWASFDDNTVRAFKEKTGLDAKRDLKSGDFSDANFRKWTEFRTQTFTDFLHEIDHSEIKSIPKSKPSRKFTRALKTSRSVLEPMFTAFMRLWMPSRMNMSSVKATTWRRRVRRSNGFSTRSACTLFGLSLRANQPGF